MPNPLETGISALDRKLDGGLPPGSLVALSASPASQSEQVIRDLSTARKTLLLTTRRPRDAVERSLARRGLPPENIAVRKIDPVNSTDDVLSYVRALDTRTNLVLDPMNPIEQLHEQDYVQFVSTLQDGIRQKESVAVLHCLTGETTPENRGVTEYMADVVFELSTDVNGENIENRLVVPKFRDGHPFKEVLKLELRNKVAVDTSRDIG